MRGSSPQSPVSMSAMSSINYLRLEHEDPVLWDVQVFQFMENGKKKKQYILN